MRKLIVALVILAIPGVAAATDPNATPRWISVDRTPDHTYYLDEANILRQGERTLYRVRLDYHFPMLWDGRQISRFQYDMETNCATGQVYSLRLSQQDSAGNTIKAHALDREPIPEALLAKEERAAAQMACEKRRAPALIPSVTPEETLGRLLKTPARRNIPDPARH